MKTKRKEEFEIVTSRRRRGEIVGGEGSEEARPFLSAEADFPLLRFQENSSEESDRGLCKNEQH